MDNLKWLDTRALLIELKERIKQEKEIEIILIYHTPGSCGQWNLANVDKETVAERTKAFLDNLP